MHAVHRMFRLRVTAARHKLRGNNAVISKAPPVRAGDACRHALRRTGSGRGLGAARTSGASRRSYGALTFGVTWKPALPAPVTGLLIRPEVRWDHAFTNNHPFNAQTSNNAVTLGIDAVLTF